MKIFAKDNKATVRKIYGNQIKAQRELNLKQDTELKMEIYNLNMDKRCC